MMDDSCNVITIGRLEYIKECPECITCEFVPPCRLCVWVSREEMADLLNHDEGIIFNRKYHIGLKKKKMRKLYKLYGKGKDENEMNVIVL